MTMTSIQSEAYLRLVQSMSAYDKAPCSASLAEMLQRAVDMAVHDVRLPYVRDALVGAMSRAVQYLDGVKPPVRLPVMEGCDERYEGSV